MQATACKLKQILSHRHDGAILCSNRSTHSFSPVQRISWYQLWSVHILSTVRRCDVSSKSTYASWCWWLDRSSTSRLWCTCISGFWSWNVHQQAWHQLQLRLLTFATAYSQITRMQLKVNNLFRAAFESKHKFQRLK